MQSENQSESGNQRESGNQSENQSENRSESEEFNKKGKMENELLRSDWYQNHQQKLQSSWSDSDFIRKTIAQIKKDFAKFNLNISEFEVIDDNTKEILLREMRQLLQEISNLAPHQFTQLIYTIDLPEKIFQSLLEDGEQLFENLASCILIREAYKVYLRSKF